MSIGVHRNKVIGAWQRIFGIPLYGVKHCRKLGCGTNVAYEIPHQRVLFRVGYIKKSRKCSQSRPLELVILFIFLFHRIAFDLLETSVFQWLNQAVKSLLGKLYITFKNNLTLFKFTL